MVESTRTQNRWTNTRKTAIILDLLRGGDAGELAFLQQHGCDEIQGYYFSKPLPADEFVSFFREKTSLVNVKRSYGEQ